MDDVTAAARTPEQINRFPDKLSSQFNAKNLREIEKILGVRITRDRSNKTIFLDQEQYLISVLERFGMTAAKIKVKRIPVADYKSIRPGETQDKMIDITEY